MSYTTNIKNELAYVMPEKRCCALSEIAGLINTAGDLTDEGILFRTENWAVARKFFTLLTKTFNIDVEGSFLKKAGSKNNSIFEVRVVSREHIEKVSKAAGILSDGVFCRNISGIVVKSDCCKRAYTRGAFLAGGSVASPEKEYHLEVSLKSERNALQFINLLMFFEIGAKMLDRHQYVSVYIKISSGIADFLNVCGAKNALFSYENTKAMKEVRNGVNRLVNCDTANIGKTVAAAQKQIKAIEIIEQKAGLSSLSENLQKAAIARKENPDIKLEELGALLGVGKSGINHRLRKIEEIAASLE